MITKTDFDTKLFSLNRKITQNKIKYLLVESELNKSKTYLGELGASSSHINDLKLKNCLFDVQLL